MNKSRIELTDSAADVISKMSDGNPGAIQAMMEIIMDGEKIDPQATGGGLLKILIFDTWGIYGTDIYVLWSDKCGKDTRKMLMIMRACQLGFIPQSKICAMAADQTFTVNIPDEEWESLDERVCTRLKEFQRPTIEEPA